MLVTYRPIELKKVSPLPFSHLYHLEPIGIATAYVESLTGYISRLAEAHSVSASTLFGFVVAPLVNKPYMLNISSGYKSGILSGHIRNLIKTINGIGDTARIHINVLETLTLRHDLVFLTLQPWSEVISERHLCRSLRIWCPECFDEQKNSGKVVYEQLLWTLKAVEVCPLHLRLLESRCPKCKCESLPVLAAGTRPGYCSNCKQWLGNSRDKIELPNQPREHANNDWQLLIATMCGELIASAPQPPEFPKKTRIATAVYECISRFAGGRVSRLAELVNMPSKTVSNWRSGYNVPQLDFLLRFCHILNIRLTQLLVDISLPLGRDSTSALGGGRVSVGFQKFIPFDQDKIVEVLESALTDDPVPSLREISKRCTMNCKKLQAHFPLLCQAIIERYIKQKKEHWEKIGETMEAALLENPPPSMIALASRLGYAKSTLYQRLPERCHKIAERFLNYQAVNREQAKEDLRCETRSIAKNLYERGTYPSELEVAKQLSKPGRMSSKVVRIALRQVKREIYEK
jgi:transcriptional regulator with XRE-family HTH domain